MAKNRPGLPEGFEIDLDGPVQLGDYLDEDFTQNTARVIAARRAPPVQEPELKPEPPKVRTTPVAPQMSAPVAAPQSQPPTRAESVLDLSEARRRNLSKGGGFTRPERVQLNMKPETVKMFNDIVEFVQRYSLQNDAKASEIFDAVVNVLHDAKEELTFHDVPRRGKWGTPTAKAFPTALGNAFARAISVRYAKHRAE